MSIVGYDFYLNGVKHNPEPVGDTYTFTGLTSDTGYDITAVAIDRAGNRSPQSSALRAFTQPPDGNGSGGGGGGTTPPPPEQPLSPADQSAVDNIIATRDFAAVTPGILLAITGPKGFYKKAYGTKDIGLGSPAVTIDDHFRMASITKTFTATALLMCVKDGLCELDDTIEQYVPGIANGNQITIHQVLAMRAGLHNYSADLGYLLGIVLMGDGPYAEDEPLKAIKAGSPSAAPNAEYAYNNSNAIVAGAIVEKLRGRKLRDVMQTDIFTPLGLSETSWPTGTGIPNPAMVEGASFNVNRAGAAGALVTTISDLSKWAQALRDGTLITPELHDLSIQRYSQLDFGTPPPSTFGYGYFNISFGKWMGHDGSISGFNTACVYEPESGATIVVAVNVQAGTSAFYTIMKNIALYLYPGSMDPPNLNAKLLRPLPATIFLTGKTPAETNKVISPTGAIIRITGGVQPGLVQPSGRGLAITGSSPTVSVSQPLTIVGSAASTGGSITIPTHQVGDLIVLFAFSDDSNFGMEKPAASGTVPSWTDIDAPGGANQCHSRTAYAVATATNHTTGNWTGISFGVRFVVVVLRNQGDSPIGGHSESGGVTYTGGNSVAPSVTMSRTDGTSVLLHFFGQGGTGFTSFNAAPAGYTQQAAAVNDIGVCLITKNDTTSDGSVSQGTNVGFAYFNYRGATVEIKAK